MRQWHLQHPGTNPVTVEDGGISRQPWAQDNRPRSHYLLQRSQLIELKPEIYTQIDIWTSCKKTYLCCMSTSLTKCSWENTEKMLLFPAKYQPLLVRVRHFFFAYSLNIIYYLLFVRIWRAKFIFWIINKIDILYDIELYIDIHVDMKNMEHCLISFHITYCVSFPCSKTGY